MLGIGALLLVSVLASLISDRIGAPLLLVFLLLGMLLGQDGPGGIVFNNVDAAFLVASLALAIILFDGGLRTPRASFRLGLQPAIVLATLGVIVTAGITGAAAVALFELSIPQGLLIGAIVGSTDAAAVFYLLHAHGLQINERLRATLEIESGSNDPMAVFLTITLIELVMSGTGLDPMALVTAFVWQMLAGGLLGGLAGLALATLVNRVTLTESLYPVLVLAAGIAIFGLAGTIGSSGFLAAYVAGVVAGNNMRRARHEIRRFHDGMAWLSQVGLFLMLGLLVTPSELIPLAPAALGLAAVLILVARPVAVVTSLSPFRFDPADQMFISWVGLRGAVPIVLGLFPLLAGTPDGRTAFNVAFFVVLVSLLVQGWTVAPAARWLGLQLPSRAMGRRLIELDAPGLEGHELVVYRIVDEAPAVGVAVRDLPLPREAHLITVVRGKRPLATLDTETLAVGDHVYLLAHPDQIDELEALCGRAPLQGPRAEGFYGAFTLHGHARVSEVAALYGVDPGDVSPDQTLDELLRARFGSGVAVGDRIDVGNLAFIARAVEGNRVTRVGLQLQPARARAEDTH